MTKKAISKAEGGLYGCDGGMEEYRSHNETLLLSPSEFIDTPACDLYIPLDEGTVPDGFGYPVGPGTRVTKLLLCDHYHYHENLNDLLNYTSEQTTLRLELEEATRRTPPLKQIAPLILRSQAGSPSPTGFMMRMRHIFDETAVIIPLVIRIHMHATAHMQDRGIVRLMRASGGEQTIANESLAGHMDSYPQPTGTPLVIHKSDSMTVECYFRLDPTKLAQLTWFVILRRLCDHSNMHIVSSLQTGKFKNKYAI